MRLALSPRYQRAERMVHGHLEALAGERITLPANQADRCEMLLRLWDEHSGDERPEFLALLAAT